MTDQPPQTGDPVVDRALADFTAADGDLTTRVEAAVEAHRRLQRRLTDPSPTPPGSAVPGP